MQRRRLLKSAEGSEANNVDIIARSRAANIFGERTSGDDENSVPVPNLRFGLQRNVGQWMEFVQYHGDSQMRQGDFVVEGLIPGKYGVYMFPNQGTETACGDVQLRHHRSGRQRCNRSNSLKERA